MVGRTAKLEAALRVNAALLVQAERLIAAYVAPELDRGTIINELIALFDGRRSARPIDLRQRRWARLLTASTTTRRSAAGPGVGSRMLAKLRRRATLMRAT